MSLLLISRLVACSPSPTPDPPYRRALQTQCHDTMGWRNGAGWDCNGYASQRWCAGGAALAGMEWTLGEGWKYPERNCCVCGKHAQISKAYPPQGARNESLILKDDTVMVLQDHDLRYFAFVDPDHAVARGGDDLHDGGWHGEAFHTYLVHVAPGGAVRKIVARDYSVSSNVFARKFGAKYFLFGGLAFEDEDAAYCNDWAGCEDYFGDRDLRDGIRVFEAASLEAVRNGSWWETDHESAENLIIRGRHPGCVTMRHHNGVCEYDGKVSVVHLHGRYHLFARANLKVRGGRWIQVASSVGDDPFGPYLPFQLLQMRGYDKDGAGNVYFASVDVNPLDPGTILGLFPVNMGDPEHYVDIRHGGNGDGEAFIGVSLSCDAVHWSDLTKVIWTVGRSGRTYDQPADGFFLDEQGRVTFYVHRNVPHISPQAGSGDSTALVRYTVSNAALRALTLRAKAVLPGCVPPPSPPTVPKPPARPSQAVAMPPVACSSEYPQDLTHSCLPWCSNDSTANCPQCKCRGCTFCRLLSPSPPLAPSPPPAQPAAPNSSGALATAVRDVTQHSVVKGQDLTVGLAVAGITISSILVLVVLGRWMMRMRDHDARGGADRANGSVVVASTQLGMPCTNVEHASRRTRMVGRHPRRGTGEISLSLRPHHSPTKRTRAFTVLHEEQSVDHGL